MKTFKEIIKDSSEDVLEEEISENQDGMIAKQIRLAINSTFKDAAPFHPGFEIKSDNGKITIEIMSKSKMKMAMQIIEDRLNKINKKAAKKFELKKTKTGFILT